MSYNNRENHSGGNRNFKPRFNSDRPDMHKATCAQCGKICEVPFRPTGSKPVLCKDCFRNTGGSDNRRSEGRSFDRSHSEERQMYDAVCSQCGKDCQIPFQPRPGREVFCSRCFEQNRGAETGRSEQRSFDKPRPIEAPNYKAQFEALNAKMDKILALLTPIEKEIEPVAVLVDDVVEEITEEKEEEPKEEKVAPKKAPKAKKSVSVKKK